MLLFTLVCQLFFIFIFHHKFTHEGSLFTGYKQGYQQKKYKQSAPFISFINNYVIFNFLFLHRRQFFCTCIFPSQSLVSTPVLSSGTQIFMMTMIML